jgi:DNA polymerase type B, organellar and viral
MGPAPLTLAERSRRWRQSHPVTEERRTASRERQRLFYSSHPTQAQILPFIGVDGEGAGIDELMRQNYLLMHAGRKGYSRELFRDNNRLSTEECLNFILSLPARAILVGYFFTYDATQIIRDLSLNRIERLFLPQDEHGEGNSPYTFWNGYAIEFRPRQYFRVALTEPNGQRMHVIPGSARTVNEVGGFFQKPFVEALKSFNIGDDATIARIAEQKDRRSAFTEMTKTERDYCASECQLLAQLMEDFRSACRDADIKPSTWRGAGSLAAALHTKNLTPLRIQEGKTPRNNLPLLPERTKALLRLANETYYGGRFEIQYVGHVPGPVYESDISSAYPDAMRSCPCPFHSRWRPFKNEPPDVEHYMARITFHHPRSMPLCSFPVRQKGALSWPRQAQGAYWSVEIEAGIRAGSDIVEWKGGYFCERRCDCRPFDWVNEVYETRKSLGKQTKGYPLKVGIAALYGKLAQRLGAAPWRDLIAASYITAATRAKLIDAYAADPHSIIMLATDGIFSRKPLSSLVYGSALGQWEAKERPTGLFVVQPGVYWSPGSDAIPKTRGIPRSKIIERRHDFERLFDLWARGDGTDHPPTLSVEMTQFIGHRLALSRNRPETAGQWRLISKDISFEWDNKRDKSGAAINGMVTTAPQDGSLGLKSQSYDPSLLTELTENSFENEAQDDYRYDGNVDE